MRMNVKSAKILLPIIIFHIFLADIRSLQINYVEEAKLVTELFEDASFLLACSYHFNSTRTLTVTIQKFKNIFWDTIASALIVKLQELNIPVEISWYLSRSTQREFSSVVPAYVRDYPSESSHSYILLAIGEEHILNYLKSSENSKNNWTAKDNYMVIVITHSDWQYEENEKHNEIFEEFWTLKILNVLIIHKNLEIAKKQFDNIYIYDLFQKDSTNKTVIVKPSEFSDLPKTYLERTWNLNKYGLNVTMFESFPNAILKQDSERLSYEGRDWKVISNLAQYMNFKIAVNTPNDGNKFGYRLPTGEFTGAMKDLIEGFADISGNERYIKYYNTSNIDFTMPAFYTKQLVVIVPKAQKLSTWESIYMQLNLTFWLYLLLIFCTSTVIWYILRKIRGKVSYLANMLDMMSIFLTMSLNLLIRATSHSQRVFLSFCMLFSLIVMCLIQSSLLDAIAHPRYNREINTLKQLDESGLSISTLDPNLLDTFDESLYMKNLSRKIFATSYSSDDLLQVMVRDRNISLLTSKGEAIWYMTKFKNMLHLIPEYPREYFVSYMIPKGSPYATRIHNLLGKMCAAGLVLKWDEDTKFELQLQATKEGRISHPETDTVKVYKLVDFQVAFVIWSVGITLSAIILLVENSVGCRLRMYSVEK